MENQTMSTPFGDTESELLEFIRQHVSNIEVFAETGNRFQEENMMDFEFDWGTIGNEESSVAVGQEQENIQQKPPTENVMRPISPVVSIGPGKQIRNKIRTNQNVVPTDTVDNPTQRTMGGDKQIKPKNAKAKKEPVKRTIKAPSKPSIAQLRRDAAKKKIKEARKEAKETVSSSPSDARPSEPSTSQNANETESKPSNAKGSKKKKAASKTDTDTIVKQPTQPTKDVTNPVDPYIQSSPGYSIGKVIKPIKAPKGKKAIKTNLVQGYSKDGSFDSATTKKHLPLNAPIEPTPRTNPLPMIPTNPKPMKSMNPAPNTKPMRPNASTQQTISAPPMAPTKPRLPVAQKPVQSRGKVVSPMTYPSAASVEFNPRVPSRGENVNNMMKNGNNTGKSTGQPAQPEISDRPPSRPVCLSVGTQTMSTPFGDTESELLEFIRQHVSNIDVFAETGNRVQEENMMDFEFDWGTIGNEESSVAVGQEQENIQQKPPTENVMRPISPVVSIGPGKQIRNKIRTNQNVVPTDTVDNPTQRTIGGEKQIKPKNAKAKKEPVKRTIKAPSKPSIAQLRRDAAKKKIKEARKEAKETVSSSPSDARPSEPSTSQNANETESKPSNAKVTKKKKAANKTDTDTIVKQPTQPTEHVKPDVTAGLIPTIPVVPYIQSSPWHSIGKVIKPIKAPKGKKAIKTNLVQGYSKDGSFDSATPQKHLPLNAPIEPTPRTNPLPMIPTNPKPMKSMNPAPNTKPMRPNASTQQTISAPPMAPTKPRLPVAQKPVQSRGKVVSPMTYPSAASVEVTPLVPSRDENVNNMMKNEPEISDRPRFRPVRYSVTLDGSITRLRVRSMSRSVSPISNRRSLSLSSSSSSFLRLNFGSSSSSSRSCSCSSKSSSRKRSGSASTSSSRGCSCSSKSSSKTRSGSSSSSPSRSCSCSSMSSSSSGSASLSPSSRSSLKSSRSRSSSSLSLADRLMLHKDYPAFSESPSNLNNPLGEPSRLESSPSPPESPIEILSSFEMHLKALGSAYISAVSPIPWCPFGEIPVPDLSESSTSTSSPSSSASSASASSPPPSASAAPFLESEDSDSSDSDNDHDTKYKAIPQFYKHDEATQNTPQLTAQQSERESINQNTDENFYERIIKNEPDEESDKAQNWEPLQIIYKQDISEPVVSPSNHTFFEPELEPNGQTNLATQQFKSQLFNQNPFQDSNSDVKSCEAQVTVPAYSDISISEPYFTSYMPDQMSLKKPKSIEQEYPEYTTSVPVDSNSVNKPYINQFSPNFLEPDLELRRPESTEPDFKISEMYTKPKQFEPGVEFCNTKTTEPYANPKSNVFKRDIRNLNSIMSESDVYPGNSKFSPAANIFEAYLNPKREENSCSPKLFEPDLKTCKITVRIFKSVVRPKVSETADEKPSSSKMCKPVVQPSNSRISNLKLSPRNSTICEPIDWESSYDPDMDSNILEAYLKLCNPKTSEPNTKPCSPTFAKREEKPCGPKLLQPEVRTCISTERDPSLSNSKINEQDVKSLNDDVSEAAHLKPWSSKISKLDVEPSCFKISKPEVNACDLKIPKPINSKSINEPDMNLKVLELDSKLRNPNTLKPDMKPCHSIMNKSDDKPCSPKLFEPDVKTSYCKTSERDASPRTSKINEPDVKSHNCEISESDVTPSSSKAFEAANENPCSSKNSVPDVKRKYRKSKKSKSVKRKGSKLMDEPVKPKTRKLENETKNEDPKFQALLHYKIPRLGSKIPSTRHDFHEVNPMTTRPRHLPYYQYQSMWNFQPNYMNHPNINQAFQDHHPMRGYPPSHATHPMRVAESYQSVHPMQGIPSNRMFHPMRNVHPLPMRSYVPPFPMHRFQPNQTVHYPQAYYPMETMGHSQRNYATNCNEQQKPSKTSTSGNKTHHIDRIMGRAFGGRKYRTLKDLKKRTNLSKKNLRRVLKNVGKIKRAKWRISKFYLQAYEDELRGISPPRDQEPLALNNLYRKVIKSYDGCKFQRMDELVEKTSLSRSKIRQALKMIGRKRSTKWRLVNYRKPLIHYHRGHKKSK
ncbi:uncharacterized protein LOC121467942 [Drosophila elegans]|uniref:uncharacterized protein LOC121467942 n=1 Tax=Drosophila elegans TaxID=30023 RepID=UPI001BC86288|nr:uncharacterized protein LOC121467942 [Drosophila elegans]